MGIHFGLRGTASFVVIVTVARVLFVQARGADESLSLLYTPEFTTLVEKSN